MSTTVAHKLLGEIFMRRLLVFMGLASLLSSCVLLVEDEPTALSAPPPSQGQFIYTCQGGRLAVTYAGSQVTVFYDGANRTLTLRDTTPRYRYSDGVYTWEASGRSGSIFVSGRLADRCSY
jgi:membrane-bound inhibitor of C-type lysozyme